MLNCTPAASNHMEVTEVLFVCLFAKLLFSRLTFQLFQSYVKISAVISSFFSFRFVSFCFLFMFYV